MFKSSYRIATVLGIPIKVHISLLILVGLLVMRFQSIQGLFFAVGLVASIALHELGHSAVAIRTGCRVRQITLLFLGGAAQMESIPTKPRDELLMAIAGPSVSLALGLAGAFGGPLVPLPPVKMAQEYNLLQLLGFTNIAIVVFNLIPAFPMDGGRVFRSLLARKVGRLNATRKAAQLGKIIAILFGIYALAHMAIILIAIAFFVYIMAENEYRMVQIEERRRQAGWGIWPPFQDRRDTDDGEVFIGPPPYEKWPGTRTGMKQDEKDGPFRSFFR